MLFSGSVMVFDFDPHANAIEVKAGLSNGEVISILRLILDTGANRTVLSATALKTLKDFSSRVEGGYTVETANGPVPSFGVRLPALFALGHMKEEFVVLVHAVDASESIDGVIGLDFLRGHRLCLDFVSGEIELS